MNEFKTGSHKTHDAQRLYWQAQLNGELPILQLPTLSRASNEQGEQGLRVRFYSTRVPDEFLAILPQDEVESQSFLLTVFFVLLHRYTGQDDLLIGTCGKSGEDVWPLRLDVTTDLTFQELQERVRRAWLDMPAQQELSLAQVMQEFQLTSNPLQVLYSSNRLQDMEEEHNAFWQDWAEQQRTIFELGLVLTEGEEGLFITCEYDALKFDEAMISRLLNHFQKLLRTAISDPALPIGMIPMLTTAEREQLLVEWNDTARPDPQETVTVQSMFEEQVARTPDNVAVAAEGRTLTYRELNSRANKLANRLQKMGVGPESMVGICMERSLEMIVGLLGILKSGAAYVPIDPSYPADRIAYVMKDAAMPVLLTQAHLRSALPAHQAQVICLDSEWETIAGEDDANAISGTTPNSLAYVIYTSGSTGKPKGVLINHANVVRLFSETDAWFRFTEHDVWTLFHSYAFDFSVWEIWGALLYGGKLVVVPYLTSRDPDAFYQLLVTEQVTVLNQTPSAFRQLMAADERATQAAQIGQAAQQDLALRYVIFGGEALDIQSLRPWWERHGDQTPQLVNMYGITETTVHVTYRPLTLGDLAASGSVIGRPIPDLQAYVLDRAGQPTPIGVPGELYIGGRGLARGYLNRPELTEERFLPHPFAEKTGERLYRTGDLARFLPSGELEYWGRIDDQVKIRGFRIELGEIEAVLAQHPLVVENRVLVREDEPGDKRLVAYVVPDRSEQAPSTSDLRAYLSQHLPAFMVPSFFVTLDAFPLSPNGKLDQKALPAPELTTSEEADYVSPSTPVEELITGIFAEALQVERIGIHDHFFESGGHSLLANTVVSRLRDACQTELTVRHLFDYPTAHELARYMGEVQELGNSIPSLPIEQVEHKQGVLLSFEQQRMWFLQRLWPDNVAYHVPMALRLQGELHVEALEWSLQEIVRRHSALRTTFPEQNGQPIQRITPPHEVHLPMHDLSETSPDKRWTEALQFLTNESARPFDLIAGPVWRVCLVRLDEQDHLFLLTMHHIVTDGWSLEVLGRELTAFYSSRTEGKSAELHELQVQYADYAHWQRHVLQDDVLGTQLAYWRDTLAGSPSLLQIPSDRPRPPQQTFHGEMQRFRLRDGLTDALKALSRHKGVTLFMTLLAAFKTLLYRYTGETDIVIGTPTAHRGRRELEDLVGFFVNTLVLRTDLSADPTFEELLHRIREVALDAYVHQDVPFEKLVEALQPERHTSYSPLFQVMFQVLDALEVELPGLQVTSLAVHNGSAKFDLEMTVEQGPRELAVRIEYNRDLFDSSTIHRMMNHFQRLLEEIIKDPNRAIAHFPLMNEQEQQQLVAWNETDVDYPREMCLHQLFESQVERTPDAVALVFENEALTYLELNVQANRLAHHLQKQGVGPDVLVGICMERSLEMVVALFGILKAGGAYVPIDPAYPTDRLVHLVEDSRVPVLLTQEKWLHVLPEMAAKIMCLDREEADLAEESDANPRSATTSDHAAYMIYTSGSTGKPKGVMNTHRGVVNRLLWVQDLCQLTAEDRVLQKTPFSFDVSVGEFFWPMLVGGCLVVARPEGHRDSAYLLDVIRKQQITSVHFVPSMLKVFLEEADLESCSSLRQVLCSGEALPYELQERFHERLQAKLYNLYGPTEAAVEVSYWECRPENRLSVVPIGHPGANTKLYILDKFLQPVPIGVPGELHIGGVQVARGYHNRPDLTAEKFIASPFVEGDRLYKTGDLVRYLPDGAIQYLGRMDHQVKIRGFRIELGEIETALAQHPGIREALVTVHERRPGDQVLVAYVVVADEREELTGDELSEFLKRHVPDYMVPAAFVMLDAFPLSPNGKLDRKALPIPELTAGEEADYVPPNTPVEELITGVFAEVLQSERVGLHDHFFAIGGHSLLANTVISRLRDACRAELTVRHLFDYPTASELARYIGDTQGHDRSLPQLPIEPVAHEQGVLLSFEQQRMWFLQRLWPEHVAYNVPMALRLQGELRVEALEWSLQEIVRRHAALRTTFPEQNGQPLQRIAPSQEVHLPMHVLSETSPDKRWTEALQFLNNEAAIPFNLISGPVWRACLVRLDEQDHLFLLTMHHIVTDGWSLEVLARELTAFYSSHTEGKPAVLHELQVQYADYAHWQRHVLQDDVLDTQLAYWRDTLAGSPSLLQIPSDRPRPPQQTFHGEMQRFRLRDGLTDTLKALSRRQGVTLFMTLLAAFKTLLYRYTGETDIVVGTPTAHRGRRELEDLVGFFVNTLVLRTDLSADPTFEELLHRMREVALGAYVHQDVPFDKLVEVLQPERHASYSPLFQVMFQVLDALEVDLPGLQVSSLAVHNGSAKFDLELTVEQGPHELAVRVEYNTDLFDASTIRRMMNHFQRLLEEIVQTPDRSIARLPLLDEQELQQLVAWNETDVDYGVDVCLHRLFEAQVERTPDAVALVFENDALTYRELNERANRLAHHLQKQGVGPDVLVGVCMERSVEMVVALYGIVKAGGAYVPIDPTYPADRLRYMLEDSQVPVLLTQEKWVGALPELQATVLCLDRDDSQWAGESGANPASQVTPGHAAYMIYTSGSTGRPKGVLNTHRGIVNRLLWMQDEYQLTAEDRVLQKTPFSFDVSVWEFFWPLLVGARMVVAKPEGHRDGAYLVELICQQGITTLHFVPSMLQVFLEERAVSTCSCLRHVFCSGEALPFELQERFFARLDARLHNLYGPTEAAVDVTYWECQCDSRLSFVPIGRPVANTKLYILDAYLQPVPIGVSGELHIGGVQVARGYHNRPDLTAEKFIASPFAEGERLYKTGDLARYLPDGTIQYLGRLDHQVKIRGLRIELGEIEESLAQHPAVRETLVTVYTDGPGGQRLVAYVTLQAGSTADTEEWRHFLKRSLPDYMVPAAFVVLDAFPLSPNGKVDRRALPVPERNTAPSDAYTAPRNESERRIAELWQDLLRVEQVGIHDNFFLLGGHSLLLTQLMSRIRHAFEVELSIRDLFDRPTVADLASFVTKAQETGQGLSVPPLQAVTRGERLPMSFAQQRLWFYDQYEPGSSLYNIPLILRVGGLLDVQALEASLHMIVHRHESLRTTFAEIDEQPVQLITAEGKLPLVQLDLSHLAVEQRQTLALQTCREEAEQPFDLVQGPLLRAKLVRLAAEEHLLLLTMHHIISDGWSLGVLTEELAEFYRDAVEGKPSAKQPLAIQYADYASWQRSWLQGEALEQQLRYWREKLGGKLPVMALPLDRPRPAKQTFVGVSRVFVIPQRLAVSLQELSRREGVTLFMTLLAAFNVMLHRQSGQFDLLVGSPIAGRNRNELEGLIGFFVNTLVLRTDLSGSPTFREVLQRVRQTALEAYAHQDVPFEKLVEELQPERNMSISPLFQVIFALQNTTLTAPEVAGLRIEPVVVDNGKSKFDLSVMISEEADGLHAWFEYNTDLFEAETISRMFAHYQQVLESVVEDPALAVTTAETRALAERLVPRLPKLPSCALTPEQSRIWAKLATDPQALTNRICTYRIEGPLDGERFLQAYHELTARHGMLRTLFTPQEDGTPLQVVKEAIPATVRFEDLSAHAFATRATMLAKAMETERTASFDLATETGFRAVLYRLTEHEHLFWLTVHPIAGDAAVVEIIGEELGVLYGAMQQGSPATNEPSAPHFAEYAVWSKQRLNSGELAEQKRFWQAQVQEAAANEWQLPHDADDVSETDETRAICQLELDAQQTAQLLQLAAGQETTLDAILLTGLHIWASLVTEQTQIATGLQLSGRHHADLARVVGRLAHSVVLNTNLAGNPTALQVVEQVRQTVEAASAHQEYPLALLQEESDMPISCELSFAGVCEPIRWSFAPGVTMTPAWPDALAELEWLADDWTMPTALLVAPQLDNEVLILRMLYDPQRYFAETAEQFLTEYAAVLEQMAERPDVRLKQMELPGVEELF